MALFDAYQSVAPREGRSAPAVIVAIDEFSLSSIGQWPWPRDVVARLLQNIAQAGPTAIGVDILFPEPDRLSPRQLAGQIAVKDPALARRLQALPDHDALLAGAIESGPVVLGMAGLEEAVSATVGRTTAFRLRGEDPRPHLRHFAATLRSLPVLDDAAIGHGLLSVDPRGGVVRRVPLIAAVQDTLTPALAIEMLRVGSGAPAVSVTTGPRGVKSVSVADVTVPTDPDGAVWIHFRPSDPGRSVSAADVLHGRIDPAVLSGKLVLIGATGLGLLDYQTTPIGDRMPGIEIHAQLLESILEHALLRRPPSAAPVEAGWLLAAGVMLILLVPVVRPRHAVLLFCAQLLLAAAITFALFMTQRWLIDAAWPAFGTTLVFGALLGGTLAESDRQRRALARALAAEREAAARAAGELEAARRIQLGMLPPTSGAFYRDKRFELEALLDTAKTVGGDLYDYFKLGENRLFFLVGDVSGKGLAASIFMAVSKALYKSAALREAGEIGAVMHIAQAEIARDNPEAFFVTLFAGWLDLETGQLEYCNAGHETPLLVSSSQPGARKLSGGEGPPLCVLDDFEFRSASCVMAPGETLCLVTDGVTEAMDAESKLYGRGRLESLIARSVGRETAGGLLKMIWDDVGAHAGNAERSDDITILVLKWLGPKP
jgi:CHASE2 domain-containing sensor protein/serine phosphatase RsbU (regulator of sigma subunit)